MVEPVGSSPIYLDDRVASVLCTRHGAEIRILNCHMDWSDSVGVTTKNGKVGLCITTESRASQKNNYSLPTIDDLISLL